MVVVNGALDARRGLEVTAQVLDLGSKVLFSKTAPVDIGPDASVKVFAVPEPAGITPMYFLALTLNAGGGRTVSRNVYWLSTKPDVLEWAKSEAVLHPAVAVRRLRRPAAAPAGRRQGDGPVRERPGEGHPREPVERAGVPRSPRRAQGPGRRGGPPVLWEDNYVTLLPGERRELTATYAAKDLGKAAPVVTIDGWNVAEATAK